MSFPRLQQGGAAGSCGKVNSDSAYIVAMNSPQVAGGSHCGQYVTVTNTANGKSVRAQVADTCVPLSLPSSAPLVARGVAVLRRAAADALSLNETAALAARTARST